MVFVGLLLGLVGIDVNTGAPRMTFGIAELGDGIGFVPVAIGLFGIAELAVTLGKPQDRALLDFKLRNLWPSRDEMRASHSGHGARHRARLGARRAAGRRRRALLVRGLRAGEEVVAHARAVRPRRDRGRRGAGGRQQCRRADELHPAAHARHSRQRHHGVDGGRADDPGDPAGAAGDDLAAAAVLGRDRLDVARQPDADRAQPAADRTVGGAACACPIG